MHSITIRDFTFHFNSDLSGNCEVDNKFQTISIPCHIICELVAEWVRRKKIEELESRSVTEILGFTK